MNHILCKLGLMVVSIVAIMSSCKESDLDGVSSSGQPVINRVYVLDTVARHKDSTIVGAEPNTLLVINGQNLGGVIRAYFNEYETSFNTNYNTNTDLIIRLPADAPTDSTATNKIRLVTARGEAIFAFKVIAKPNVASYDIVNFGKGRGNITFKGKNFADVTKVVAYAVPAKAWSELTVTGFPHESPVQTPCPSALEIGPKSSVKTGNATSAFTNSSAYRVVPLELVI